MNLTAQQTHHRDCTVYLLIRALLPPIIHAIPFAHNFTPFRHVGKLCEIDRKMYKIRGLVPPLCRLSMATSDAVAAVVYTALLYAPAHRLEKMDNFPVD